MDNFLPKPVCLWLISQTRTRLESAKVKDPERGGSAVHANRSNTGAGFSSIESDIVLQLTRMRIAAAISMPVSNLEPSNVLHYDPGQEYRPHFDFVTAEDEQNFQRELATMGQRVCTFLVYLNDAYEGGETEFPRLDWRYKGKTGDALIFWNISAAGQRERDALHAGLPVTKGEKWLFSQWVREKAVPLV
jgi:predicted 2-oxoglutarate/Fe(II)-dependent dioxygenase YbiX